jgi:hypothetical protein
MKTNLPAAPWTTPDTPDARAIIITPDGYFSLNLEGLDVPDKEATARALRQAVAALPDLLAALAAIHDASDDLRLPPVELRTAAGHLASAALAKAGAVPPTV